MHLIVVSYNAGPELVHLFLDEPSVRLDSRAWKLKALKTHISDKLAKAHYTAAHIQLQTA
jgi:hypothetical protein